MGTQGAEKKVRVKKVFGRKEREGEGGGEPFYPSMTHHYPNIKI